MKIDFSSSDGWETYMREIGGVSEPVAAPTSDVTIKVTEKEPTFTEYVVANLLRLEKEAGEPLTPQSVQFIVNHIALHEKLGGK